MVRNYILVEKYSTDGTIFNIIATSLSKPLLTKLKNKLIRSGQSRKELLNIEKYDMITDEFDMEKIIDDM